MEIIKGYIRRTRQDELIEVFKEIKRIKLLEDLGGKCMNVYRKKIFLLITSEFEKVKLSNEEKKEGLERLYGEIHQELLIRRKEINDIILKREK